MSRVDPHSYLPGGGTERVVVACETGEGAVGLQWLAPEQTAGLSRRVVEGVMAKDEEVMGDG
jgi:hypothetical protein